MRMTGVRPEVGARLIWARVVSSIPSHPISQVPDAKTMCCRVRDPENR